MKCLLLSTALALIPIGQPLLFGTTAAVIRAAPQKEQAREPWQVGWFHFERAWYKRESGDLSGAIADYDKVIEMFPGWVMAYNLRASTKAKLGDMSGACADWRRADSLSNPSAADRVRDQRGCE
ncbi:MULTISPECIES: hypothetical protein [unclassified Prochlorococcus]|uniref:hypothetical protein n=1 Tax=unclassified Prochlorococcus TaxID=2627481 RepID=UPI0005337345|nr:MULTISPECIES: hypothetical protein [unclassified Prochlorococcus]KGG14826.1 hypothetical protein EV06_1889 [Prochlorococcus sp. MIT 0602]KGG15741.1 hypothetical protein EV07_1706 [Prochlorococcus sp. MIT 0603]